MLHLLLLRLEALFRQFALLQAGHGPSEEFRIDSAKSLMVQAVAVVLDGDRLVFQRDAVLLDAVLFEELEEGLVTKHLGDLELILVPILGEGSLHVALLHVK